jgi:nicotinate-nucleotide adenylyltransferase
LKAGILGGTFDPVHVGHLGIAEEAMPSLGLAEVIFVPAREPWLKGDRGITQAEKRLDMLYLAIASNPSFHVSTVDIERPGPSYTVDTLTDLSLHLGQDVSLYFILGLDALAELPSWREPGRIVEMCHLVGALRPGCRKLDVKALEQSIPGASGRITILDNRLIDISSSQIRERVAAGLSIDGMVPPAVAQYIAQQGLYRKGA